MAGVEASSTSNMKEELASTPAEPNGSAPPKDQPGAASLTNGTGGAHDTATEVVELDDFGLPIRKFVLSEVARIDSISGHEGTAASPERVATVPEDGAKEGKPRPPPSLKLVDDLKPQNATDDAESSESEEEDFKDAVSGSPTEPARAEPVEDEPKTPTPPKTQANPPETAKDPSPGEHAAEAASEDAKAKPGDGPKKLEEETRKTASEKPDDQDANKAEAAPQQDQAISEAKKSTVDHNRNISTATTSTTNGVIMSEFSHQQLTTQKTETENDEDEGWQEMPAYAPYDIYDDDNKLVAKEHDEAEDETYGYAGLGGAGKGYTRVLLDEDAQSANSIDDNTNYLFKGKEHTTSMLEDEENQRDAVSQLQATKDLLTEGQRIAYVGLTRLEMTAMVNDITQLAGERKTKKEVQLATENMKMWSQKMMIRLYTHMDISSAEQIMIEQLSDHGVVPTDLTPVLMANARVKNPMAEEKSPSGESKSGTVSPRSLEDEEPAAPPPPYSATAGEQELSAPVRTPSQMETTTKIDIDLRWTVLCDLFLVLIADSIYDSRSRQLLERVGKSLDITWIDICRFEKKVTDALEMQQNAEKENWNEDEHMENRRKMALRRRYVMMGLATVGGGLVIGLSAGLMAPLIGAGLAAGFTTIGVTGTSGFLAGAGGAAIITSGAAASGSYIGVKAANRRTGAVKTFEYRPLHNNKRVNLIITVSGWMTGKVDDVRLPYSTVDPIMGDIYSVLWEPEMLTSMGDTINILATEALTQGLQQLLGSTILISLMAALQLPVVLTKLAYLIDNPWAVSLDRATAAGLILADSLIDRNLGTRPVTLVGYSLGSRVIFSCLQELSRKGAYGVVKDVFIFGSPVVVRQDEYLKARTVVAGRLVNGYNRNDWILGYLFRLTNGGIRRVAGLAPVDNVPGLENMDCTDTVVGHMDYRQAMPRLLRQCGWEVTSDEFTEIEDPDPENHKERQRELINEIEEARKEMENQQEKKKGGALGFFRRGKKKAIEKQEWELYEDNKDTHNKDANGPPKTEDAFGNNYGVLFDVDAIRSELAREQALKGVEGMASEQLQVKELQSTLPPMRLSLTPSPSPGLPGLPLPPTKSRSSSLRGSDSVDSFHTHTPRRSSDFRRSSEYQLSGELTPKLPVSTTFPTHDRSHDRSLSNGYLFASSSHHAVVPDDNDGLQMTFDTSFENPIPPPKDNPPIYVRREQSTSPAPALAPAAAAARPEIKTSQTVPNITLSDPWAEDDDEEFGKEKEISMTFA